jgi:hypothetical protein
MATRKTTVIILTLPLMLILTGCLPIGDCTHNFVYNGTINASDSLLNDSLVIRFDNLGDIIFNIYDRPLADTAVVNKKGNYKIKGDFFTACGSDKNIFEDKDSLTFELVKKGQVIRTGKFCIKELNRQYTDNAYFTTITLPAIQTE